MSNEVDAHKIFQSLCFKYFSLCILAKSMDWTTALSKSVYLQSIFICLLLMKSIGWTTVQSEPVYLLAIQIETGYYIY